MGEDMIEAGRDVLGFPNLESAQLLTNQAKTYHACPPVSIFFSHVRQAQVYSSQHVLTRPISTLSNIWKWEIQCEPMERTCGGSVRSERFQVFPPYFMSMVMTVLLYRHRARKCWRASRPSKLYQSAQPMIRSDSFAFLRRGSAAHASGALKIDLRFFHMRLAIILIHKGACWALFGGN